MPQPEEGASAKRPKRDVQDALLGLRPGAKFVGKGDKEKVPQDGWTPLLMAAHKGHSEVVRSLSKEPQDP